MKTPIVDFVRGYAAAAPARFHMPGHKGKELLGFEQYDITEIAGADVLYAPDGIIAQSEANATALFDTAHTFYSAEGSTLAIKAMLALVARDAQGERAVVLAARNAHKAFLYGVAMLDIEVRWMWGEQSHPCVARITPRCVEEALARCEKKPHAVYITSPDYLGNLADVGGIAAVCDRYGVPLLVDNAHGAYLHFTEPSEHPVAKGATMSADSAHKTLPVITGGAYLHVAKKAPARYLENARAALSMFASTSPSYLILQSLDRANPYLASGYREGLSRVTHAVRATKQRLAARGYEVMAGEPLKIVLAAGSVGYSGFALADILRREGVECELADDAYLVLMCSPENTNEDLARLERVLLSLPIRAALPAQILPVSHPVRVLSVREAMLSNAETVRAEHAVGRICAEPTVACPPAVPIVMSGECIDDAAAELLLHYGVQTVRVVKK